MMSQTDRSNRDVPCVLVVSPVRAVAEALRHCLAADGSLRVLGYSDSIDSATAQSLADPAPIIVYDAASTRAIRELQDRLDNRPRYVNIVAYGLYEQLEDLERCLAIPVRGLVARVAGKDELVAAVREIARGRTYTSPALASDLAELVAATTVRPRAVLTSREREVLLLVSRQYRSNAICKELSMRPGTLRNHLQNMYRKLGVHNRTDLARCIVDHSPTDQAQRAGTGLADSVGRS